MKILRNYGSYEDYLKHQVKKSEFMKGWLKQYHLSYRKQLGERLTKHFNGKLKKVLCLGARTGAECLAFEDKGSDVIGIDIHPVNEAYKVIKGDFHNLQFEDNSFDVVFTNSFDHSIDIHRMIREIKRVIKKEGELIFEINYGLQEGGNFMEYEAITWEYIGEVVSLLAEYNFKLEFRIPITLPWKGEHIVMRCYK